MKKIIRVTFYLLLSSSFVSAQQKECGAMENLEYLKSQDPQLENKMLQNEQAIQNWIQTNAILCKYNCTILSLCIFNISNVLN